MNILILILIGVLLILVGYGLTVAVTAAALIWVGGFHLSLANVMGIALLWYAADLGISNRISKAD